MEKIESEGCFEIENVEGLPTIRLGRLGREATCACALLRTHVITQSMKELGVSVSEEKSDELYRNLAEATVHRINTELQRRMDRASSNGEKRAGTIDLSGINLRFCLEQLRLAENDLVDAKYLSSTLALNPETGIVGLYDSVKINEGMYEFCGPLSDDVKLDGVFDEAA